MAISGGIGYFTGLRGEDLTREMGIGGALGAIGGGVLGIVGKLAGAGGIGLKTLVTGNALSGAITSMADDTLHNRKPSIPKAVIGAALGVGLTALLVGGQGLGLANKLMNPGQVSKPSVSNQKVDVPDGSGKGSGTVVGEGLFKTKISPKMENKILYGERTNGNTFIGGHSPHITNSNPNYAVEVISINPDGTKVVKFITQFSDGKLSKIKKSTLFPDSWSNDNIINSIKVAGDTPSLGTRASDGATIHRNVVNGVEIEVIKIGDDVISGYPTGGGASALPAGFK